MHPTDWADAAERLSQLFGAIAARRRAGSGPDDTPILGGA